MAMKIVFNDSYYSDGFEEGVEVINKLLKPYHLKIKKIFIDDYESPDGEFAWEVQLKVTHGGWKPMKSKDGCAWFGGKTHSMLADYLPKEALEHNHEDLDFLVTAWREG